MLHLLSKSEMCKDSFKLLYNLPIKLTGTKPHTSIKYQYQDESLLNTTEARNLCGTSSVDNTVLLKLESQMG